VTSGQINWQSASAFDGPGESPGFTLWRDFMRWQRGLNAKLRPHGLTQPQFAILAVCGWLGRDGRHTTQQDVATFLGLDRMLVSQIASRLERQGLIDRQVSSGDQRAKCITLTRQGTTVLERALPVVESFDAAFFRDRT